jgi:hypothetical protein
LAACSVVSHPREKSHRILLTEAAEQEPERYLVDISQCLCRAALAERIDPAFATIWFSRKWNRISRKDPVRFAKQAQILQMAWVHTEIWAVDLRHSLWPELTEQEHFNFSAGYTILLQRADWTMLGQYENLLALAQHQAERGRYQVNSADLFALLSAWGVEVEEKIKGLAKYIQKLPRLKYDAPQDLKILEASVAEVARRLELDIKPGLVFEEGAWVWDLG